MAGITANKVYAPGPDQSATVGAVAVAAIGTSAPTDARTALPSAWTTGGYISEDGLSMAVSRSTETIRDWSKAAVRDLLTEFTGELSFQFLQIDEFALDRVFGSSNVTKTAATTTKPEQLSVAIGAELPPVEAWCFSMKDEDRRVRLYVPKGQVTEIEDVSFKPDEGQVIGVTVKCYDDGTGNSIYVIWDDGVVASS